MFWDTRQSLARCYLKCNNNNTILMSFMSSFKRSSAFLKGNVSENNVFDFLHINLIGFCKCLPRNMMSTTLKIWPCLLKDRESMGLFSPCLCACVLCFVNALAFTTVVQVCVSAYVHGQNLESIQKVYFTFTHFVTSFDVYQCLEFLICELFKNIYYSSRVHLHVKLNS